VIFESLFLWYLGKPDTPRYVGILRRALDGKGVSLQYGEDSRGA